MMTYLEKPANVKEQWHLVNAEGKTLGRLAAKVAGILRGKHRPTFTPNVDMGDHVVIINAEKVHLTGNKMQDKEYQTFSGYPGGQKFEMARDMQNRRPNLMIERAVKGMLPKNRLGRAMVKKLFVYEGAEHPHKAQQPKALSL